MKFQRNRRFLKSAAGAAAIASIGTLSLGGTWALFSAQQTSGDNSFAAGTVTVGPGASSSVVCNVTGMVPGDSSNGFGSLSSALAPCTYRVKYTGSASAYLAVDIQVLAPSTSLPSSAALYDSSATGLQLLVTSGTGVDKLTYLNGTTYRLVDGSNATVAAGSTVSNLLLSTSAAATDDEHEFDVNYALPTLAGNGLQGGSATLKLTFRAVQAGNQSSAGCSAGRQCNTIVWS